MSDKFSEAESRERKFIKWWIDQTPNCELIAISDIGSYERNDFIFSLCDNIMIGEVKIRNFEYHKYPSIFIEMDKITSLVKDLRYNYLDDKALGKVLYFAVYPKSRCYFVIDVMKVSHTISFEYCPKTTMGDNGYTIKTMFNYKLYDCLPYKYLI